MKLGLTNVRAFHIIIPAVSARQSTNRAGMQGVAGSGASFNLEIDNEGGNL
jgi:hypothetical protein